MVNRYRGFLKHADRDHDAVLEDFTDFENEAILFVAGHDFGRLCGGMPVELQVYEAWFLACEPTRLRRDVNREFLKLFPNITKMPRHERKRIGFTALQWARGEPGLRMNYSLE
jgi:hypothetical protein